MQILSINNMPWPSNRTHPDKHR